MVYKLGQCDYGMLGTASMVLITGSPETAKFCRDVADTLRGRQLGEIWVCATLKEFESAARQPALLGRWWYSGSADRLSTEDKNAFRRLLEKPVTTGTAVLTGTEYVKYREMTKSVRRHAYAHEIACSYPAREFLVSYVRRRVTARHGRISQGAAEDFIRRLGGGYSRYDFYLDRIIDGLPDGSEVKSAHVHSELKQVQNASFDDFIKYLIRPLSNGDLARTRKLFKCYRCVIESYGARSALRGLSRRSAQYLEIRRLINEGYIPAGTEFSAESVRKMIGEPPERSDDIGISFDRARGTKRAFTRWDMYAWGDIKIRREVETAASTSLADWYTINRMSSKPCVSDEEAEIVFFDIITRSRQVSTVPG